MAPLIFTYLTNPTAQALTQTRADNLEYVNPPRDAYRRFELTGTLAFESCTRCRSGRIWYVMLCVHLYIKRIIVSVKVTEIVYFPSLNISKYFDHWWSLVLNYSFFLHRQTSGFFNDFGLLQHEISYLWYFCKERITILMWL